MDGEGRDGTERAAELVLVPSIVGLEVQVARRVANTAGVELAQPDPDGPPLGALTWPGRYRVVGQEPAAGSVLHRWDSLVVRTEPVDDGAAGVREPRRPHPDPHAGRATPTE
ncbi:PASTA domain-containing protein [Modestobacter sp. VKM Ac-2984]|uniref:PASTA domain-containing protein n=1 Tax=Modestobacter sp. VKM Ac-2984 TaxID=3004138 RepID=UPI0022AB2F63|nr:PASTA domain-containing protein [Modestobacter sp. VKM Ac-2984]MCZ2815179.1 PASTA domain-containing protein [Modestobacter sp. VKM Ac-2984]